MEEIFEFSWEIPNSGFCFVKTKPIDEVEAKEEKYLTYGQPLGVSTMVCRYTPLKKYTGLFRIFAETPATEDGILAFANKYGRLGDNERHVILTGEIQTVGIGELFSFWSREIFAMRHALELWDAVNENNLDILSQRIAWEKGSVYYYNHPEVDVKDIGTPRSWELIAAPTFHPERLERFRPGNLSPPALYQVQKVVNDHLMGRVSPRLLWGKDKTRLGFYIMPGSLIGALWLQFAQAIDGNKEYRRCDECRVWFALSPEVARTSKKFCSNACRSRAYRGRQEKVRSLYAEGKSIEEAAEAVNTDVATARRWVEGRKE